MQGKTQALYWIQCGSCGGDTWAALNTRSPGLPAMFDMLGLDLLWHPSLSVGSHAEHLALLGALQDGSRRLDILCVEGSILQGPAGSGGFDTFDGRPKRDLVAALAARARYVVAVGTCACFGGIGAGTETGATGMQFERSAAGGLLGADFVSRSGLPVVNLPGCPCHGEVLAGTLGMLATGQDIRLSRLQSPLAWYGMLVHQGCVRNEYHEYRVEDLDFGSRGCLFFHMGCRGPLAYGPCNKLLWNGRSSKTRAGVPCVGCTEPTFPRAQAFFETASIVDIPLELPDGVDRAHYLAYKGMAAAAAPERLKRRETRI